MYHVHCYILVHAFPTYQTFPLYNLVYLHWSFALSSTSFTSLLLYVYFLHSKSVPYGTSPATPFCFSHVLAFSPHCPLLSSRYCAVSVPYLMPYDGSVPVSCSQIDFHLISLLNFHHSYYNIFLCPPTHTSVRPLALSSALLSSSHIASHRDFGTSQNPGLMVF